MTESMPQHLQNLIAGYVLGDLDAAEAAELERLMADNPAIAAGIAQVQKSLEMAYAPTEVVPPPHLRAVILQKSTASSTLSQTESQTETERSKVSHPQPSWSLPWFDRRLLNLAAVLLIVALAINNYRLWRTLQSVQAIVPKIEQTERRLTYMLQSTNAIQDASATVVVDPDLLAAQLEANNLPPLPPGQVYAVWTVLIEDAPYTTDPKGAILTDVFEVDAQGNATRTMTVPPVYRANNWVTKVAITIEDAIAPQAHMGAPILISSQ